MIISIHNIYCSCVDDPSTVDGTTLLVGVGYPHLCREGFFLFQRLTSLHLVASLGGFMFGKLLNSRFQGKVKIKIVYLTEM